MIDDIKNKLTKLLRLGEDSAASEGEIANALRIAGELMARHQLTREDIDMSAHDPYATIQYGRHWVFSLDPKHSAAESVLAMFVVKFLGSVQCYTSTDMVRRRNGIAISTETATGFAFYGPDADAKAAQSLFAELRDAAAAMSVIRYGSYRKSNGAAYNEGFALGLRDANNAARAALCESNSATGSLMLVVAERQLALVNGATDWLSKKHGITITRGRSIKFTKKGTDAARNEGRRDGANYQVDRPATNQNFLKF